MSTDNLKINQKPQRKRRWDAVLVGIGMTTAFIVVMTRLTGYSPCDAVDALQITDVGCASWIEMNWNILVEWLMDTVYHPIVSQIS